MITYSECTNCHARYSGRAANHMIFSEGLNLDGKELDYEPKTLSFEWSVPVPDECVECGGSEYKMMYGPCGAQSTGVWPLREEERVRYDGWRQDLDKKIVKERLEDNDADSSDG